MNESGTHDENAETTKQTPVTSAATGRGWSLRAIAAAAITAVVPELLTW